MPWPRRGRVGNPWLAGPWDPGPRLGRVQGEESRATSYTTLAPGSDFRHELEIKRSRFITVLRRADSEDAARDLVAGLRREFHDARHHCSAFIIGPDDFESKGSSMIAHVFAGVDHWFTPRVGANLEGRYTFGSAKPTDDFATWDSIDLSGLQMGIGLALRW